MDICFRPAVYDDQGKLIYDGSIWSTAVLERAPVVYVGDPSDQGASRAGDNPLFLKAKSASGCTLYLSADSSNAFRPFASSLAIGEGTVVVVVEP